MKGLRGLKGPTAIITAASRGIGAACARELAARGYRLALLARSADVTTLAAELGGIAVTGSVTRPEDLARLVDATMDRYGRIDAVVNNTGHAAKGPLLELTDEDWHQGLDILLLNVVRLARLVTPVMQQQHRGAIVNISSFVARQPDLAYPVSATLRAGLDNFARLYTQQYARDGIRMNNVLPGKIDTSTPDATRERGEAGIPAGRQGTPAEVARVVAHLLSDDASYVSGQSIGVDGGLAK